MMGSPGYRDSAASAASMPSISGMFMSRSTTSGSPSLSSMSRNMRPSAASPTTRKSEVLFINSLRPLRKRVWSSTIITFLLAT